MQQVRLPDYLIALWILIVGQFEDVSFILSSIRVHKGDTKCITLKVFLDTHRDWSSFRLHFHGCVHRTLQVSSISCSMYEVDMYGWPPELAEYGIVAWDWLAVTSGLSYVPGCVLGRYAWLIAGESENVAGKKKTVRVESSRMESIGSLPRQRVLPPFHFVEMAIHFLLPSYPLAL